MAIDQEPSSPDNLRPDLPDGSAPELPPFQYSLRRLLIVVTCTAVVLGATRWLLITVNAADRERGCQNNLRQIGLAILNFNTSHGQLPLPYLTDKKQGKPLYSWRVLITPYLDSLLVPVPAPDKPWNSPQNANLARMTWRCYHCPDDDSPPSMTSYVAIVGSHTGFPPDKSLKLDDFKNPIKTILLVELRNSNINWTEPRDLDISELAKLTSNCHSDGFHACFADGHVELLPADIDLKKLAAMCDPNGEY
jgi:prepilin-type processing-associated H-X9-DG protein